jgi:hypothetical protein
MGVVETSKINSFARDSQQSISVPHEEAIEIPLSELQAIFDDLVSVYNQMAETIREAGVMRGRELARAIGRASDSIKVEKSPAAKLMILNAYIKQFLSKIREALKTRPTGGEKVIHVLSKIQMRAIQIIEYIKTKKDENRKEIAFDSQQARILFSGSDGEPVSRRDTIRAMKRAERLWPVLRCGHKPNDGRMTTRLTAKTEDLIDVPTFGYRNTRQRSALRDLKIMFNLA